MRELVARVKVLHKHDLTAKEVLEAAISEVHSTNLLHERVLLASKLVEVNRCGDRSEAKEAASNQVVNLNPNLMTNHGSEDNSRLLQTVKLSIV